MIAPNKLEKRPRVGPYSKAIQRGALGEGLDGRSREGKFLRRVEGELLSQVGASPSFAQRLLIRRVAKMMLLAEKLDEKLTSGADWTPHDARTFGGLNNAIRVALRDIGLQPMQPDKPPTLAAILAERKATTT